MEQNSIKAAQQSLGYYSAPKSFAVVAGWAWLHFFGTGWKRTEETVQWATVKAKSHTPQRSALLLCQRVASNIAAGRRPPRSFILQQLASYFAKQNCSCRDNKGNTCPEVVLSAECTTFCAKHEAVMQQEKESPEIPPNWLHFGTNRCSRRDSVEEKFHIQTTDMI